jgi:AcrR family transcriptional regulator
MTKRTVEDHRRERLERRERRLVQREAERAQRVSHRVERKAQLLEAAIRVVRRDGPNASMDEIAREAGITKPIIYRAFGDREGLTKAVADHFADELAQTLGEQMEREDTTYREAVAFTIDAYLAFIERDPKIVRFLVARDFGDPDETPQLIRKICALVTQSIGEQLRALKLDSGAAEPWAYAIVGAVHLAGDLWLENKTMTRARLVEYLTALVWDGMKSFTGITVEEAVS